MSVRISIGGLSKALRDDENGRGRALRRAVMDAATRGARTLAKRTPRGVTGAMANSWKPSETPDGARIENDAPYAGVVEAGARPHSVSPEGMAAIQQWAERVLGQDPKTARQIAWGIAGKLRTEGQVGRFIARDYAADEAPKHLQDAINRSMRASGIK